METLSFIWIGLIKDIVISLSGMVAMYVGLMGVNAWRRQTRINTEHESAKQLLKSVYKLKEAASGVRGSIVNRAPKLVLSDGEIEKISPQEKQLREYALAVNHYWEPIREVWPSVKEARIEAMVSLGKNHAITTKIDELLGLIYELHNSISDYYRYQLPEYRDQISSEERKRVYYISFDVKPDINSPNKYSEQLDQVFSEIENQGELLLLK